MKGFIVGMAGMIVIAVGAAVILDNMDYSSQSSFTSKNGSVRIGE